jgi:WD40 repeat protein
VTLLDLSPQLNMPSSRMKSMRASLSRKVIVLVPCVRQDGIVWIVAGGGTGAWVTQAFVEQDRARSSIRAMVRHQGTRLKAATPTGMIAALVAAACTPAVSALLGLEVPGAAKAAVELVGLTGGVYITEFVKGMVDRLRRQDGAPRSEANLQQALERELLACLEGHDERAAGLHADAAELLQLVNGAQAALEAASADVQQALAEAFIELGRSFNEFRWMLDELLPTLTAIQQAQRYQTDLSRRTLVEINLLRRQIAPTSVPATPGQPEDKDLPSASGPCPYKGLAAFQAEDAQWFFGRQRLVAELVVRLSEHPFLAVVGPSGSGKSSVLRAGLLPAVWGATLPGVSSWTTIVLTPGAHPLEELAAQLGAVCGLPAGSLLDDWQADPIRVRLTIRQALAKEPANARLLLLVDQFEELFTLCSDEAERRGFIRALAGLGGEADCGASVVLGVRADFYARCAEHAELVAVIQDHQVVVGPMAAAELRQAIEGPVAQEGLALEAGLVETVLADLGDEPGSLPLLSHALRETWERRRGRTLTVAGYQDAGGVREAIGRTAETVYAGLDPVQQAVAKGVFLRLTALGEGTEDTRRRVRRAELVDSRDVEVVLDRLAKARLVTLGEDSVEVAHEALIREWPRLQAWLTEDREGLRIHRRLTEAAAEWEVLGRGPGALYRGGRLVAAREWAAGHEDRLNDLEWQFLVASSDRERDELAAARRRNRRLRVLSAVLVVLLVVAVWQRQVAQRRGDLAVARQLAAQAAKLDQQPLSLLLSLESLRLAPTDEARVPLLRDLLNPQHNNLFSLTGHTSAVNGVAFSRDSKMVASASDDQTVRRWDATTGKPIGSPLTGHTGPVYGVAFSPDGKTIASAGDLTVRRWDTATGRPMGQPLAGHTSAVNAVAFSPDGKTIASASSDQTIRLWDAATGAPIGSPLTGHTGRVLGVAFSPDGKTIASASSDLTVRLWDTATGKPLGEPLTGHTSEINGVAFSPDGKTIASASRDWAVRRWETATGKQFDKLKGNTGPVYGVAFSPDGKMIASGSGDGTVRLWDPATGKQLGRLTGHINAVKGVAFSPDGRMVATASRDQTVRLWDATISKPIGQPLTGHTGSVNAVAFSPDGKMIASASDDQTVRRWNAVTRTPIGQPLTGHNGPVWGVAFSPDGKMIASASEDQTVRRWNAVTGKPLASP